MTTNKLILATVFASLLIAGSSVFSNSVLAATSYSIANGNNATISEWSNCRTVTNATGKQIFIPTKTSTEWSEFLVHYPAGITLATCGKRIFVTSGTYTIVNYYAYYGKTYKAADIGTDAAADAKCQSAAGTAGWSGTYKALLYMGTRNPDTVLPAGTSFYNPGGGAVANSKADFFTDKGGGAYLTSPIAYNELGLHPVVSVWTAFQPNGSGGYNLVTSGTNECTGYRINTCYRYKSSGGTSAWVYTNWTYQGFSNATNNTWAGNYASWVVSTYDGKWPESTAYTCYSYLQETLDSCLNNKWALYCVEQ